MYLLATICTLAGALFLIVYRYTGKVDSNLPMVLNLMIGAHMMSFEEGYAPAWVYVALVSALFLRFEFMNRTFIRMVRFVETIALAFIVWQGVTLLQAATL